MPQHPSSLPVSLQTYGEGTHFSESHGSLSSSTFLGPGLGGECPWSTAPSPTPTWGPWSLISELKHFLGSSPGAEGAGGCGGLAPPIPVSGGWPSPHQEVNLGILVTQVDLTLLLLTMRIRTQQACAQVPLTGPG